MGSRGPSPIPTEILRLRGSWRGDMNKKEPRPQKGNPTCPATLNKEQRAVWKRLTALLHGMNVLTKVDGMQLERYCVYLLRWRDCERFIAANGLKYPLYADPGLERSPQVFMGKRLPDGKFIVGFGTFPEARETLRLDKALKQIEANFGLTPSARSRIMVPTDRTEKDELEAFMASG